MVCEFILLPVQDLLNSQQVASDLSSQLEGLKVEMDKLNRLNQELYGELEAQKINVSVCMYVCMCVYLYVQCVHYVFACTCLYVCLYMYLHVSVCVYMCVFMCILNMKSKVISSHTQSVAYLGLCLRGEKPGFWEKRGGKKELIRM